MNFEKLLNILESIDNDIKNQQRNAHHHTSLGDDSRFWGNQGAGVILQCSETGRYLLGLRSQFVNEPNTWNLFGGAIDDDENPKEAVLRELSEEIGLDEPINLQLINVFKNKSFKYFSFYGKVSREFKPILNWEHKDAKWFSKNEFPKNLHFGLKEIINKLP